MSHLHDLPTSPSTRRATRVLWVILIGLLVLLWVVR